MPETDRNTEFDNLSVQNSLTAPDGTTYTGGLDAGLALENTDGTTLLTTATLQAGTDLSFADDGDGTATLDASVDTFSGSHADLTNVGTDDHHAKTTSASDLTDVSADSVGDAHHTKTTSASDLTDVSADSVGDAHHAKTTGASDLTDVSADSVGDAHHAKTQPGDITSSNWGDYEIQKDGADGQGVINFVTQ